jgi:phosphoribosylanthranilate isomerase
MINRWEQGRGAVDALIASGRLERVEASRDLADLMIKQARTHLDTATQIAESDPEAAFQTAYDAARKALAAILANQGLRATGAPGAHALLLEASQAQLDPPMGRTLRNFDWLRRTRNSTEYPTLGSPALRAEDVQDAIPLAADIVDVAARVIPNMPVY